MTREDYINKQKKKSDELYEYITKKNQLIKFYENIINRLEKDVIDAECEITEINDELDVMENWLGGYNE